MPDHRFKSKDRRRTLVMAVPLTPEEDDIFWKAAEIMNVSRSRWVRESLLERPEVKVAKEMLKDK